MGGDWTLQIDAATHSVQVLQDQKGGATVEQRSGPTKGAVEIDAGPNDHITVEIASLPVTATAPNLNWLLARLMQRFDEFAHGCAGFG